MTYWGGSFWGSRYWGLYFWGISIRPDITLHYSSPINTKIYVGNTVSLSVECDKTTTAAALCYLYVIKPEGTTATWTASSASITSMVYTTTVNDFSSPGIYKINAYIQDATSSTYNFTGDTFQVRVYSRGE